MNLFGVGPTEMFAVLIVILVLFGPDKLPEIAKKIGGASRELRGSLDSLNEQMNNALEMSMQLDKAQMMPPAPDATPPAEPAAADTANLQPVPPPEMPMLETTPPESPPPSDAAPPDIPRV